MANFNQCGSYTKFEGGLCLDFYKKEKEGNELLTEDHSGLNGKNRNYRYNMIKGRIAKTLIQELFWV